MYLAWKTFRDKSVFAIDTEPVRVSPWRVIVSGILVNTLHPKLTIFFFAFLPQFVPADSAGALPLMVYLSAVFMAVTLVVFSVYGVFAAAVRTRVFSRSPKSRAVRNVRRAASQASPNTVYLRGGDYGPVLEDGCTPVVGVFDLVDRHLSFDDARVGAGTPAG